MKKLLYLFSITIALTAFTSISANAQAWSSENNQDQNDQGNQDDHGNHGNQGDQDDHGHGHGRDDDGGTSSTQLPINGGVELLMAAGVIIGVVAVQRYKAVKPATTQE
jgi:ABC-type Zn2+ transport system substrate-binding protein/surface adhesin